MFCNSIFTPAGRLCSKLQDFTGTGNVYAYSPNSKQHAVRRIYNGITNELSNLRWDANGNLAQQTVYSVNNNTTTYQTMRMLFWDEDDRLNLVAGDGYLSYYAYGHDGNRAIKMTGNAAIDQTGTLLNSTNLENITIYPNEYLTVTQAEYTKYYYAGGNRIASKIGTGGFGKMQRLCTQDLNLNANANALFSNILQQVVNTTNQPNDEYPVNTCGGYNVATELLTSPLVDFYISQTNLNFTQNNLLQQFRQNLAGGTEAVYYFHSDHLGSASWITNGTGAAVQHLLYLPFGEHFVNERNTTYDERFSFTGKERDAETGYYYHGARFNNSDIGWLSVDPMADKYPSMSPYAYCAWNPVKLVDPEGMEMTAFNDWYKDAKGHVQWDANVHSQADLKKGETYIGRTACMVAEGDDKIIYGDQYGHTHSSVPLHEVRITADSPLSNNQQAPSWVDNVSFGVALETSMIGGASKNAYIDYVPLEELKIAKGFYVAGEVMKYAGRVIGGAGLIYTGYRTYSNDQHISLGEGMRIGLQAAAVATSFIPLYGTAISLGLTAIDFFFGDAIEKIGSK